MKTSHELQETKLQASMWQRKRLPSEVMTHHMLLHGSQELWPGPATSPTPHAVQSLFPPEEDLPGGQSEHSAWDLKTSSIHNPFTSQDSQQKNTLQNRVQKQTLKTLRTCLVYCLGPCNEGWLFQLSNLVSKTFPADSPGGLSRQRSSLPL